MTGLVRPTVTDTWELVVVCDRCGDSERAEGLEMRDFGVLWQAVLSCGWLGLPWPLGPHFCPGCEGG